MIERITSLSQNRITHDELLFFDYQHKIFNNASILDAFVILADEKKSEDIINLYNGLKRYYNQGRTFFSELEELLSKNLYDGIRYLAGLSQLPDELFSDINVRKTLYDNVSSARELGQAFCDIYLYRFRDHELYKKHANFLASHPENADKCASLLVVLHESRRHIYEKISRMEGSVKLKLLLAFHILFQRGLEYYNTYYESHIKYFFLYPEYAIEMAKGFSRLAAFPQFSKNIQLLILNPMLASHQAELIAEIATDKDVKLYEIFSEQKSNVANDILQSIEILKKNKIYHARYRNLFIKYPFYALNIATAVCYLHENDLLGLRGREAIEKNPKAALQAAKEYVQKRLYTIKIDRAYLARDDEDLYLSIPKLLAPDEYEETLCVALGGGLINTFSGGNISYLFKPQLLKRLGVFFINCVNQTNDILENDVIEDIYYILNYKAYSDPDRETKKIDKIKLKNEVNEKLEIMLNHSNPIKKYHQILAVMTNALELTLPNLEEVSLMRWKKIYFYVIDKLDNYQIKKISLNSFFNHLNEIKIQNKETLKNIWEKSFKDFSPEELLKLAKLVQIFDKKHDRAKKKCLFAIQMQLASTKKGLLLLNNLFKTVKKANTLEEKYMKFTL